jgi:hypothetical protein
MASKHQKTVEAIFASPIRATIPWRDIEAMLGSLGATITEREGSRILVELNKVEAVFHRPHPRKETQAYIVRNLRSFLHDAGIKRP